LSDTIIRAVYDANVLYDASIRDLCLWLAVEGAVEARWTEAIHQEWTQHLAANRPDIAPARIQKLRQTIDQAIPDCLVTGYDTVVDQLVLPDPDDRHVVAAAIACSADLIVTFNGNDFPSSALAPYQIEALSPDDFVNRLITLIPETVCRAAMHHRANLQRPSMTVQTYLETLCQRGLPLTAKRLSEICDTL
jgi:hypothetical protein